MVLLLLKVFLFYQLFYMFLPLHFLSFRHHGMGWIDQVCFLLMFYLLLLELLHLLLYIPLHRWFLDVLVLLFRLLSLEIYLLLILFLNLKKLFHLVPLYKHMVYQHFCFLLSLHIHLLLLNNNFQLLYCFQILLSLCLLH